MPPLVRDDGMKQPPRRKRGLIRPIINLLTPSVTEVAITRLLVK
jgi:hypothetical protein